MAGAAGRGCGARVPTPMAQELAVPLEAARAAGLAAHFAAGVAVAQRSVVAARLLRCAEALARAAVASLSGEAQAATASPAAAPGEPASCAPPPSAAARRRRRRRRRKKAALEVEMLDARDEDLPEALPAAVATGAGPPVARASPGPSFSPSAPATTIPDASPLPGPGGRLACGAPKLRRPGEGSHRCAEAGRARGLAPGFLHPRGDPRGAQDGGSRAGTGPPL